MPGNDGLQHGYRIGVATAAAIALHVAMIATLFAISRHWHPPRLRSRDDIYVILEAAAGGGPSPPAQGPAVVASPPHQLIHLRRVTRKLAIDFPKKTIPPPAATSASELSSTGASNSSSGVNNATASGTGGGGSSGQQAGGSGGLSSGDSPFPADQVDEPPVLVSSVVPDYPEAARRERIEGAVVLQFVVDRQGKVEDSIKVIESIPMLDRAAIDALRKWRFSPGRDRDGIPVRVLLEAPLRFTLRSGD